MDIQRHIGLRSIDVPVIRNKEAANKASTSKPKSSPPPKDTSKNITDPKGKEKKEDNQKGSNQGQTFFSLEDEISKIKIYIPLIELLKNYEYHSKVSTVLNPPGEVSKRSDSLNLQDDSPTILFGPHVDAPSDEDIHPFYVSLNIYNSIMHNSMLDSRSCHNMMPRVIMDKLGLDVTKPYK